MNIKNRIQVAVRNAAKEKLVEPQEASKIVLAAVDSSNIDSFGYSESINILAVQFKSGDLYLYAGVPKQIYAGMVEAESCGSYLNKVVKPHYLCAKVE